MAAVVVSHSQQLPESEYLDLDKIRPTVRGFYSSESMSNKAAISELTLSKLFHNDCLVPFLEVGTISGNKSSEKLKCAAECDRLLVGKDDLAKSGSTAEPF